MDTHNHPSRRSHSGTTKISKPCFWTEEAPPFWVVREPDGQMFAVFEDIFYLAEFVEEYPHVFHNLEVEDRGGTVAFCLGYTQ